MVGGVFSLFGRGNVAASATVTDVDGDAKSPNVSPVKADLSPSAAVDDLRPCETCGERRKTTYGQCSACLCREDLVSRPVAAELPSIKPKHKGRSVTKKPGDRASAEPLPGTGTTDEHRRFERKSRRSFSASTFEGAPPPGSSSTTRPLSSSRPSSSNKAISASSTSHLHVDRKQRIPGASEGDTLSLRLAGADRGKRGLSHFDVPTLSDMPRSGVRHHGGTDEARSGLAMVLSRRASSTMQVSPSGRAINQTSERRREESSSASDASSSAGQKPRSYRNGDHRKAREESRPKGHKSTTNLGLREVQPGVSRVQLTAVDDDYPPIVYRNGDHVLSLISRMRNGHQILELGSKGVIMSASVNKGRGVGAYGVLGRSSLADKCLIQFSPGFDWVLAPHQISHRSQFDALTAAGLAGGFRWGDRVQSLVSRLQPRDGTRGLLLGDVGTVIGPGAISGKLAIRCEVDGTEWSLWPAAVCRTDAYAAAVACALAGGFRRGDRVQCRALRPVTLGAISVRGSFDDASGGLPNQLDDGHSGLVIGPGHMAGRLLVCFDGIAGNWSIEPTSLMHGVQAQPALAKVVHTDQNR
eukprot:TRINITY_DN62853_c0_g1_i1.p1 TRINITY_DN62853_c0_g1~~TRINITY_DN62853_c0_g1_i1.p1  ORF type:complete len:584 (-),score=35.05 TRINITY_DN62853_c0_g1_i1:233-1984(-)